MSELRFLPSIGMTGTWALKPPYNELVMASTQYTCTAIESLAGAIASDRDPYAEVYEVNGADESDFELDLKNNAYLVTITSGEGDVVVFPNTAIVSVPNTDGVIYRNLAVVLSLSSLPDEFDTSTIEQQLRDLVLSKLGVNSSSYVVQIGGLTVLTREQSDAYEQARTANIASLSSPIFELTKLRSDYESALQRIQHLEQFILDRGLAV